MGLKRWLHQLSIRNKTFFSQLLIIMIPITLLGMLGYFYYASLINEKVMGLLYRSNEQMASNIDGILESAIRLSEFPFLDGEISEILLRNYETIPTERRNYQRITDRTVAVQALYRSIIYPNSFIESVELIAANNREIYYLGSKPSPQSKEYNRFLEEDWYHKALESKGIAMTLGIHHDPCLTPEQSYASVVRSLILRPFSNNSDGIIKINLRQESLQKVLEDANWAPGVIAFLVDDTGQILCHNQQNVLSTQQLEALVPDSQAPSLQQHTISIDGKPYVRYVSQSIFSDWRIVSFTAEQALFAETRQFGRALFTLAVLLFLVLLCVSYVVAQGLTNPILRLKRNLQEMGQGNLAVRAQEEGGELGELAASFNRMAAQMQSYLQEIYTKENEKRDAELLALQAQINPHFLYNTLRAIRWMADAQGADNVVDAIDALIGLFRSVANMRGDLIPIREDIEIIRLYSQILMFRYMDRFTVEYDIDASLLDCCTIKFLLQPLLENAIFHGFEESGRTGTVRISVHEEGENIVFSVWDNGRGMDSSTMERVLNGKTQHGSGINKIGIYNVVRRIRLTFGEAYGICMESVPNEYTLVRAIIPKVREEAKDEAANC